MVAVQYLQISLRSRVLIPSKNLHSLLIKPCYIIETTFVIISKRIFNLMLKREKQMSSTFLRKNAPKMSVWNVLDNNDTMMVVHNIKRKTPSTLRALWKILKELLSSLIPLKNIFTKAIFLRLFVQRYARNIWFFLYFLF